ncbi:MAG: hypothetical protein ACJ798_05190 [Phenylobacterium sp.]
MARHPAGAAGARPVSQAPQLDALAMAQLSGGIRLVSADVEAQLARFSDPAVLQSGKVNLISLEAVQVRLGERWPQRKDQVFAFADRVLQRSLGLGGVYLRVSDTDYFIMHPELGRYAGQAACLKYLREVLTHFLGDDSQAGSGVLQVTKIGKGRLEAQQVDAGAAEAALSRGETGESGGPPQPGSLAAFDLAEAPRASLNRWTPFAASDGRQLRISATLDPIYELKGFTRIGFRMIRRVIVVQTGEELSARQISALSSGDILRTDLATITRGIDRVQGDGGERQLSLIVPLSFASLSSQRGRAELTTPLKEAGGLVRLGVISEILDIEGVPAGALLAATSLVRPFSLLVVGHLEAPTPKSFTRLAGAGLQSLSFECPAGLGDAEFMGWANATVSAARKVAKSVLVYHADSAQRAGILASFGATHVSLANGGQ